MSGSVSSLVRRVCVCVCDESPEVLTMTVHSRLVPRQQGGQVDHRPHHARRRRHHRRQGRSSRPGHRSTGRDDDGHSEQGVIGAIESLLREAPQCVACCVYTSSAAAGWVFVSYDDDDDDVGWPMAPPKKGELRGRQECSDTYTALRRECQRYSTVCDTGLCLPSPRSLLRLRGVEFCAEVWLHSLAKLFIN